jgi:hypothetical protein
MEQKMTSTLYQQLFPSPKKVVSLSSAQSTHFEECLPHQFNLGVIDENVRALLDQFGTNINHLLLSYNGIVGSASPFVYEYDKLLYRAQVSVEPTSYRNHNNTSYNFRLSNDGFLYLPDHAYSLKKVHLKRHHGTNWSELDSASVLVNFPVISSYAASLLGNNLGTQFFYSSEIQRMDLRFLSADRSKCLTFSFEPGYPEDSFEDFWWGDQESPQVEGLLTTEEVS